MSRVEVPRTVLEESFEQLGRCGAGEHECVMYWLAAADKPDAVLRAVHPAHSAGAFGYEVDSAYVNELFLTLRTTAEAVRVQVHTHPRAAGHSSVDDNFSLVPATGFLSLVIPDFACGPVGLAHCHLVEMQRACSQPRSVTANQQTHHTIEPLPFTEHCTKCLVEWLPSRWIEGVGPNQADPSQIDQKPRLRGKPRNGSRAILVALSITPTKSSGSSSSCEAAFSRAESSPEKP